MTRSNPYAAWTPLWHGWNKAAKRRATIERGNGWIYAIRRGSDGAVKIGFSISPERRICSIRREEWRQPDSFSIVSSVRVGDMVLAERSAHARLSHRQVSGEWFALSEPELDHVFRLIESEYQVIA